ncbi:MAG: hypothetical protein EBY04_06800 [Actinobacteria bacterium]|nr:hypothetical protein [Actinomycetota bacterium]
MRALRFPRRRRAVIALCCAVLAWCASTSDTVQAASNIPNELISSNPQPNATVTVVPTQLQLVFRNKLDADDAASLGVLLRCSGTTVSLGSPVVASVVCVVMSSVKLNVPRLPISRLITHVTVH